MPQGAQMLLIQHMDTQIHVMSLPTSKYEKTSWFILIEKIFKLALESNHSLTNQQLWVQHYLFNRKNNSLSLYAKISEIKMDAQSSKIIQQNKVRYER